jgi:hypothetical protein
VKTTIPPTAEPNARVRTAFTLWFSHGAPMLLGAGLAVAWRSAPFSSGEFQPGPPVTWVADRDADAVIGLDAELFVSRRFELESPVELAVRSDRSVWALSARDGHPLGAHDLVLHSADGRREAVATFGPVFDLDLLGDDALVVEHSGEHGRVVRVGAARPATNLLELPTATCAAGAGERLLVGTTDGEVWLVDATTLPVTVVAKRAVGGPLGDVAVGPTPGSWWTLGLGGAGRLCLLDPDLTPRWMVAPGVHALHLAPVRGAERVWLADTTEPFARRFGAHGAIELDVADLPLAGLDRAVALADGGLLLAAPGAVLRLDADGAVAPGQGGFDFLVDIDR